jgi:hypothetical protein
MGFKKSENENVDWIHLTLERVHRTVVVKTVMNFGFPLKAGSV